MTKTKDSGVTIDLSSWTTMKQVKEWGRAVNDGDIDVINALMVNIVKAWPHAGDPSNVAAYDDLSPEQWGQVFREARDTAQKFLVDAIRGSQ